MLCFRSITPNTCENDISVGAIVILRGLNLLIGVKVGLHRFPLASLVIYSLVTILLFYVVGTVNDVKVVDYTLELTLLSSCYLFSRCEKTLCV